MGRGGVVRCLNVKNASQVAVLPRIAPYRKWLAAFIYFPVVELTAKPVVSKQGAIIECPRSAKHVT